MVRSSRSRRKQQKQAIIFRPYEDVAYTPGSWPPEIPSTMTHIFRVIAHPDFECNPFAAVGPSKMFENAFQLQKIETKLDFCYITASAAGSRPDFSSSRDDDNFGDSASHAGSECSSGVRGELSYPVDSDVDAARWSRMGLAGSLVGPGSTSNRYNPRFARNVSIATSDSVASRSLSPDTESVDLSRRSSLVRTELECSRGPSPSASSSQDSSLSSIEAADISSHSACARRVVQTDHAYIHFADNNLPFASPPTLHQTGFRPPNLYGNFPQEGYPPAHWGYQQCDPVQRFSPPGYGHALPHPTEISPHIETARAGNPTTASTAAYAQPGAARQGQPGPGSRSAVVQPVLHPAHPAGMPAIHPMHVNAWPVPLGLPARDPRIGSLDDSKSCPSGGNYAQAPSTAPSQAFKDFMADLGRAGQPPVPLLPPLPPVHAPPLHKLHPLYPPPPPPPPLVGFSVPLRSRLVPCRSAPKERDWTTHFEALGRKGRKKKSSKKKKRVENVEVVEIKPAEKFQCPMCDRDFERRNGLAIHMKWHYKENNGKSGTVRFLFASSSCRSPEDRYLKGLSIAIPPLSFPPPMYFPPGVAIAPPPFGVPTTVAPELTTSSSSGSDVSPAMSSLQSSASSTRTLSANTTLLSVSPVDTHPGPITPLATPPPSPGGTRVSSLVRLSAADILTSRARSESTRSMWDLFGSDD